MDFSFSVKLRKRLKNKERIRRRRERICSLPRRVREKRSVQRRVLVGRVIFDGTRDHLEGNLLAIGCDGEERAILVAVLQSEASLVVDRALDHRVAVEGQVAELVALPRRVLRYLEDRDGLPAPESEVQVVPPLRRRSRLVALNVHALNVTLMLGPHVRPPGLGS